VIFHTDEDLHVGEFGIATRMVQPARRAPADGEPVADAEPGHTMIYRPKQGQPTQAASLAELGLERERVSVSWDGEERRVDKRRLVIGRSKDCDVQLGDPNVSRRHAELRQEGASYWIVDLDSTNGIEVNGRRLKRAKLEDGDRVVLGSTELTFRRESE
jgi:pSer/pThr/pTyr-binding forkhead associated (FHA) protein